MLTKVSGSACFVAGTQVLLGDGTSKSIEEIEVGDEVLAADPETGETFAKRVLDTYVHEDVETYVVETSSGSVTSTAEHPFWVDGRGWTPVRELQPGDKLVDADGMRVKLLAVGATGETATVHNLNVDGLHNYHVQTGDHWVLVHNDCQTNFVVKPNGETVVVPDGAVGPTPVRSGAGVQYSGGSGGHGLDPRVASVRIMEPTEKYAHGYSSYLNASDSPQAVNPYTGRTMPKNDRGGTWLSTQNLTMNE